MEQTELERVAEAILFAAGEPVELERIAMAAECDPDEAEQAVRSLMDRLSYERRGIRILRLEHAYQMCSSGEMSSYVTRALETRKPPRLSSAQLETLTVIAYYQPATRAYIEQIRGVDSSYTVSLLLDRELIEECGRLAVPGRPILYRTTTTFLRSFGLSSLEELPELPSAGPEDGQITLEMQAALEKLRGEQTENLTDEELLEAARELSATEADIPAAEE